MKKGFVLLVALIPILFTAGCKHHGRACLDYSRRPEVFGPTDVNAASGNMGLSAAFNAEGTVTVFKWPNPSYYDHIRYMTESRDKPLMGAFPNEGAFAGVYWETPAEKGFSWLRGDEFTSGQFFNSDDSDCVITRFESERLGLVVRQVDVVAAESDLLVRHYHIRKSNDSHLRKVKLVHFANFHPVVTKYPRLPLRDWCHECRGNSHISYFEDSDAFVYYEKGKDMSTGKKGSVAIAIGTARPSSSHQAGIDSYISMIRSRPRDPYLEASTGRFSGNDEAGGEVTAGLMTEVSFDEKGIARHTLYITASETTEQALRMIKNARERAITEYIESKRRFWWKYLSEAPMPDTDDERVLQVAKRSIISVLQATASSGAIVASISTQGPYGEDWPRDGAFINVALHTANLPELVEKHNRFYARVQSRGENKIWLAPEGNWASVYYADGVHGMPIPWEIDETGFTIWTLWDHYRRTGDTDYLEEVYPAMEAAADFLVKFKDPETGLHKKAYEDDIPEKRHTTHGAVPIYAGLKAAARAARKLGHEDSAKRYEKRAEEVRGAIMEHFYHPECNCFVPEVNSNWDEAWAIYPGKLFPYSHEVMQGCAESAWRKLEASINLSRDKRSLYEPKAMLALAHIWKNDPEKMDKVRKAIKWQSRVPITDTGIFGEVWVKRRDGSVLTGQDMPHVWHHALYYAAAVKAFGEKEIAPDPSNRFEDILKAD